MGFGIKIPSRKRAEPSDYLSRVFQVNNENGFTLIEMLVVMVILSVAVLGMESMQIYAIRQIQSSDDIGTAATIALDAMETIRSMEYSDIVTVAEGSADELILSDKAFSNMSMPGGPGNEKFRGRGGSLYYVNWTVRSTSASTKTIDVQVRWYVAGHNPASDPEAGLRRYVVTTIVHDPAAD